MREQCDFGKGVIVMKKEQANPLKDGKHIAKYPDGVLYQYAPWLLKDLSKTESKTEKREHRANSQPSSNSDPDVLNSNSS